ncbi:hypothetical protein D3C75_238850 [compost metagenome]
MNSAKTSCKESARSASADTLNNGSNSSLRETVAVTGASGCPDEQLLTLLTEHYNVIVLLDNGDRGLEARPDQTGHCPYVQRRPCDLFSLPSAEKAMQDADYAIYFVQPKRYPARLTQACSADINAIQADHFARAACKNGIQHIAFLCSTAAGDVSPRSQLLSCLEIERILGSYGLPVTTLRTGQNAKQTTAGAPGPSFQAPAALISAGKVLLDALVTAYRSGKPPGAPPDKGPSVKSKQVSDVRSIQRVVLPDNTDAAWAARYYLDWLGSLLKLPVRIDHEGGDRYRICLRTGGLPILELTRLQQQSDPQHTMLRISGGVLAKQQDGYEGRLEFLQLPGSRECIIAIHDYLPSLPWVLYKHTQALVHLWVMAAFRRHLQRISSRS